MKRSLCEIYIYDIDHIRWLIPHPASYIGNYSAYNLLDDTSL